MHGMCIVPVYEDDILIVSDSLKWIESAKRAIGEQFRMTNFGEAKFILGMDIVRNKEAWTICLSHEQYSKEILEKYGMLDNTPSTVPMAPTHYRDGWRGRIRPRQGGIDTIGTRHFPSYPRICELLKHVYRT
jgi:hypothetical protein